MSNSVTPRQRKALFQMLVRVAHTALHRIDAMYPSRFTDDQEYHQHLLAFCELIGWFNEQHARIIQLPEWGQRKFVPAKPNRLPDAYDWIALTFGSGMGAMLLQIDALPDELRLLIVLTDTIITHAVAGQIAAVMDELTQLAAIMELPSSGDVGVVERRESLRQKPQPRPQPRYDDTRTIKSSADIRRLYDGIIGKLLKPEPKPGPKPVKKLGPKP